MQPRCHLIESLPWPPKWGWWPPSMFTRFTLYLPNTCIIITYSLSSFSTRLCILPEQELCLESLRINAHVKWKTSSVANWNITLFQTHVASLLSKRNLVRFNFVLFFFSYHYLQISSVWLSFLALWWFLLADLKPWSLSDITTVSSGAIKSSNLNPNLTLTPTLKFLHSM